MSKFIRTYCFLKLFLEKIPLRPPFGRATRDIVFSKSFSFTSFRKRLLKSTILFFIFIYPVFVYGEKPKVINIGVVLPLTGNTASYGLDPMRTLSILQDELNKKDDYKVNFIFEDGRCGSGNATTNAVNKLLNVDKVDAFLLGCSGEILQASPILRKAKKVGICFACSHRDVKHQGKYVYRTYIDVEKGIAKLSEYIKKLNKKKLAVLTEDISFTLGIKKLLQENFTGEAAFFDDYNEAETDFRTIVLKAKNKKPDGYFLNAASPITYQNLLRQLRQLGVAEDVYAYYQPTNQDNFENLGSLQDGIVFISYPEFKSKNKEFLALRDLFLLKHPEGPFDEFLLMTSYDAATILIKALRASENNVEQVISFLNSYSAPGALGDVSFDKNGDVQGVNFNIFKITKGVINKVG